MSGYQVEIDGVRRAGWSMSSAGEQAREVDLAVALADVGIALPGSRSASAATGAAKVWRSKVRDWADRATALGEDITAAADGYEANEEAAQADLRTAPPGGAKAV